MVPVLICAEGWRCLNCAMLQYVKCVSALCAFVCVVCMCACVHVCMCACVHVCRRFLFVFFCVLLLLFCVCVCVFVFMFVFVSVCVKVVVVVVVLLRWSGLCYVASVFCVGCCVLCVVCCVLCAVRCGLCVVWRLYRVWWCSVSVIQFGFLVLHCLACNTSWVDCVIV